MAETASSIDHLEVEKFERIAAQWWDPLGKFKPLHIFNPVRLTYVRDKVAAHFDRDPMGSKPLSGLRILDIGCGGGLLSEPMARLGADVVGVDPAPTNVEVARLHAAESNLAIDYRATTAEALAEAGEQFDVVLNMEVVEHVANVSQFVETCASMVNSPQYDDDTETAPGGLMFIATINRTPKAFALAIVGAEYVMRWLPRGTHQYEKLVKPEELADALKGTGMSIIDRTGIAYDPLTGSWSVARNLDVNYMILSERKRS